MSPDLVKRTDEELLARLSVLAPVIRDTGRALDVLFQERLDIFRLLSSRKVAQRVIGEAAEVTPNAVGYALHAHGKVAKKAKAKR